MDFVSDTATSILHTIKSDYRVGRYSEVDISFEDYKAQSPFIMSVYPSVDGAEQDGYFRIVIADK